MGTLQEEAALLVGIPGWAAWSFEALDNGVLCKGAVCPLITRGPNKGQPNYRKHDRATVRRVVISKTPCPGANQ